MNENIDLTKILDGCLKGTKFYNTVYGECTFLCVSDHRYYPIKLQAYSERNNSYSTVMLTKDGRVMYSHSGECTLFPSKDQRDWSKFKRFWDEPKPEKFDPKTLQPFDRVLARDYRNDTWTACLYSHHATELDDGWFVCDNTYWRFIIPYNDETKHLVGTKDDCPEYYKWWEE